LCCTTIAQQWPHLKPHFSRDLWQRERPYDGEVEASEERALFHVGLQMNGLRRWWRRVFFLVFQFFNLPKHCRLIKGIFGKFGQKIPCAQHVWTISLIQTDQLDGLVELKISETLWGAIDEIETLVVELQIGDNFMGVNWSFPFFCWLYW